MRQRPPRALLPYGVDPLINGLGDAVASREVIASGGSRLAATRPGGYRDGAEEATTVPVKAATATTAVIARGL